MKNSSLKVALVHDWLIHMRGGEKVLESLAELFPDAVIYTLFSDSSQLSPSLRRMRIHNSFLQRLPGIKRIYRWLLPFLPWVIRALRVEPVDLVISSSHCVAKGVRVPAGALHLCYCHTPMRYVWGMEAVYFTSWFRWMMTPVFEFLRGWDRRSNQTVDLFLCNSEHVRQRIRRAYGRDARVVHPPVDTEFYRPVPSKSESGRNYYFVVSAWVPYKRIDVPLEAFQGWDRDLVVAGDGPLLPRYPRKSMSRNIHLLGKVTDEKLRDLYAGAAALLFPQEEDFGIVPLEAQACGTPVIAFGKGGALESLKGGHFFYEQTPEALRKAILDFETAQRGPDDGKRLREWAVQFDKSSFKTKITQAVECLCSTGRVVHSSSHVLN